MPRYKKSMTKAEIKRMDTLWSQRVKEDAGNKCEVCGRPKGAVQLHSHHFIGRRNRSLRWWLPNGVCLCAEHHKLSLWSAHENPEWFREQMLDIRGAKWVKDLRRRERGIFKGVCSKVKDYLDNKIKDYGLN